MTTKNIYQSIYQQQIYLNSGLADIYLNGSKKSNLVFFFQELLKHDKGCIEMRISLVNAQFPVSWYLINTTNNVFFFNGLRKEFPIGNYNVSTFVTQFNSLLPNTTIAYSNKTNIFTINSTGNFLLSDGDNSIFSIMGFVKGTPYSSASNALAAPFPFNFSGLTRLNVKSPSFNIRNIDSFNKGRSKTIQTIPVNANQNGVIQYVNYTNFKTVFKTKDMTSIQIEICDDFHNLVDFQNIDWTICLQVDIFSEIIEDLETLADVYDKVINSK